MKVWVNGSFDVVHIGHIKLLKYASKFGPVTVGIDTDERIREKKGLLRPYNSLQDRKELLLSIKYVTSVVTFSTDKELEDCIEKASPDIMVIGSDYVNKTIIGSHLVERIIFFERIPSKSTSEILGYENISNR